MLPRHPDSYSDDELAAWVQHLVDDRVAEGPRLDYKAQVSLAKETEKREVAKDITSFANEVGGVILYGIPEDRSVPETARPTEAYGIDPIPDLESRIANIWIDTIRPRLPEWRIRPVPVPKYPGKVVYLAWTPESWVKPHMVEGYGDRRFYRRGQLRAVEMAEHEVENAYRARVTSEEAVSKFIDSTDVSYWVALAQDTLKTLESGVLSNYVAVPLHLAAERVDFTSAQIRQWLEKNPVPPYSWAPSLLGVRSILRFGADVGPLVELHHNGAINYVDAAAIRKTQSSEGWYLHYVSELQRIQGFLRECSRFHEEIGYSGPTRIVIRLVGLSATMQLYLSPWPSMHAGTLAHVPDQRIEISLDVSGGELIANQAQILKAIGDRLFRHFGLWEADCFNERLELTNPTG